MKNLPVGAHDNKHDKKDMRDMHDKEKDFFIVHITHILFIMFFGGCDQLLMSIGGAYWPIRRDIGLSGSFVRRRQNAGEDLRRGSTDK